MKGTNFLVRLSFVVIVFLFTFSSSSQAQWGEKMLNRVVDKTTRQAEKRVNKGVDKALNKGMDTAEDAATDVVTGKKKKVDEVGEGNDDDFLTETMEDNNEPYNSDFVGMFELEYEMYEGGKKNDQSSGKAKYYFNKNKVCLEANSVEKVMLIIDHDTNMMTMANPDKKSAITMKRPAETYATADNEEYTVTRNGDKKYILGHPCVKYTVSSSKNISVLWVDETIRFDYADAMRSFGSKAQKLGGNRAKTMEQISGFPIEIESTEKGKSDKVIIRTTMLEIGSVDENVFKLDGYEVQDMSMFGN